LLHVKAERIDAPLPESIQPAGTQPAARGVLAVLSRGRTGYAHLASPLLHHLRRAGLPVEVATRTAILGAISPERVLLLALDAPLATKEADSIRRFLHQGGGAVCLHSTLAAQAAGVLADLVTSFPPTQTKLTELLVRPDPGEPLLARMDREFRLVDRLQLLAEPPPGAAVLARASWHYTDQVVAFARRVGAGTLVHVGLGGSADAYRHPAFQQLVFRAIRHAAGDSPRASLKVALVGYGAIAREHAASVGDVPGFELEAICDRSAERRALAKDEFGVATYASADELIRQGRTDVIVVGTPPNTHHEVALSALESGNHVVCEKPFALGVAAADRMIATAAALGRTLTVYQSRRWDPDFVALHRAVGSGAIGSPFYMEAFIGGYSHPCSYWHSHEPISGGTIYDWGSHYFDWILQLFSSRVIAVTASAHKRVWHDVTNADQVRVHLLFADGAEATFLQSDIAAALKPKWYLLGTGGAVVADWRQEVLKARGWSGELVEERLSPADSPAVLRLLRPDGQGGSHEELLSLPPRVPNGFYRNLADHLLLGEPLAVTAEEARGNVAIMEAASSSIAGGGRRVRLRA
jgi:predicted dehydrogenase